MTSYSRLTGASDSALIQAVEDNYVAYFEQMAAALGGEIETSEALGRHISFPDQPTFKGAWRARLTAENADAAIEETIAWFRARSAPFFTWWTTTGTTPDDLGQRLIAHGLKARESSNGLDGSPVMIADMLALDDSFLSRTPPGFTIRQVKTEAELAAFQYVVEKVYETLPEAGKAWADSTRRAGMENAPWRLYVGWLDDKPVATNVVVEGGGIVSEWVVATLPEMRRKGIGKAITLAPLLEWRDMGYQYAGLFASEMGAPVYERSGFTYTGTRINRYLWRNMG